MRGTDVVGCYRTLRRLYFVSPSLHELWFFGEHYRLRINHIVRGRLGLKALLRAHTSRNEALAKASITYMVKNAILLETMYRPCGLPGMLDTEPPDDLPGACRRLLDRYDPAVPSNAKDLLRSQLLRQGLEVVHGLVKSVGYGPIVSGRLATSEKWLLYAPCVVNEGPLLLPQNGADLLGMKAGEPRVRETRDMLKRNFTVCEYDRGTGARLWCGEDACSNHELRERIAQGLESRCG